MVVTPVPLASTRRGQAGEGAWGGVEVSQPIWRDRAQREGGGGEGCCAGSPGLHAGEHGDLAVWEEGTGKGAPERVGGRCDRARRENPTRSCGCWY
jgi:hypothetical protein